MNKRTVTGILVFFFFPGLFSLSSEGREADAPPTDIHKTDKHEKKAKEIKEVRKNEALLKSTEPGALLPVLREADVPLLPEDKEAEPYRPEEFPQWSRDLWRGFALFAGSLPLSYILSSSLADAALNRPIGTADDQNVLLGKVTAALSISFAVSLSDFVIRLILREKKNKAPASGALP